MNEGVSSMHALAIGLLVCFSVVILLAAVFVLLSRYHVRQARRANRGYDPLSPLTGSRRRVSSSPTPHWITIKRWLTIRSVNTEYLRDILGAVDTPATPWSEALSRSREKRFFVSPPVDNWSLVVGAALPDPSVDIDACFRFLMNLSRATGEIQFYSFDRVLNFHAWACLRDGKVVRAYAWAGETVWNEGKMTLDERLLGLKCRGYADVPEPIRYGDIPPEQQNTERVALLARRWSVDFVAASEILLNQEGVESGEDQDQEQDPGANS